MLKLILVFRFFGFCFGAFVLFGLVAGCRSPQKKVEEGVVALKEAWRTNVLHQQNLPERELDWHSAVRLLLEKNPKLKQARLDITNNQESVNQVYQDLVPNLNARAGVSKDLRNLGNVTMDDVTLSADSFFNVPGFVNFSSRLYAARLFLLRSFIAYELGKREQIISLYRTFMLADDLKVQFDLYQGQMRTADAMKPIDPFAAQMMFRELEFQELTRKRQEHALQEQAGELLGDRSYRWILQTNDVPQFHYDVEPLPLADTNRVAQLQMRLVALELEAAKSQLLGIKLRYWPELNIFVTGPPLYQRTAGRTRFWDAADIRGSADLFWNIDTRGYLYRQLKQTKRYQAMQRERIRQEALSLIDRLIFTQTLLEDTQEQARKLNQQFELLALLPPSQNYLALQRYALDYKSLRVQQRDIRSQLAELNTLFWFVDEDAWKNMIPVLEFEPRQKK